MPGLWLPIDSFSLLQCSSTAGSCWFCEIINAFAIPFRENSILQFFSYFCTFMFLASFFYIVLWALEDMAWMSCLWLNIQCLVILSTLASLVSLHLPHTLWEDVFFCSRQGRVFTTVTWDRNAQAHLRILDTNLEMMFIWVLISFSHTLSALRPDQSLFLHLWGQVSQK